MQGGMTFSQNLVYLVLSMTSLYFETFTLFSILIDKQFSNSARELIT